MPSNRGLSCNLQIKKNRHSDSDLNDQDIKPVPAIHTVTDVKNNTVTTFMAVEPGWFDIVLEVNEFLSEYLVV